ncbi:MAG: hypothetical protein KJ749_04035 [Planctomycetes bacterium]|nr:hypothetical protein [Planctomycetota bacterium]
MPSGVCGLLGDFRALFLAELLRSCGSALLATKTTKGNCSRILAVAGCFVRGHRWLFIGGRLVYNSFSKLIGVYWTLLFA